MQTRTELILLQRTMVVVEGVARSLNPHINIWQTSRPVVETYIRKNVGPKALARDLVGTARVLGRFGPKLPQIAEALLMREIGSPPDLSPRPRRRHAVAYALLGAAIALAGVAAANLF
jgi:ubiquinone biosynthesis protein